MTRQSRAQRERRIAIEIQAEGAIRDQAAGALSELLAESEKVLVSLTQKYLGRDIEIVAPIKGTRVAGMIEDLTFGLIHDKSGTHLGLILDCPSCGRAVAYRVTGYADVGILLATSAIDARCALCVREARGQIWSRMA